MDNIDAQTLSAAQSMLTSAGVLRAGEDLSAAGHGERVRTHSSTDANGAPVLGEHAEAEHIFFNPAHGSEEMDDPSIAMAGVVGLGPNYRPLNVKDALSYLDEVKLRFRIDTPGVIDRVSSLFRGHPALIQGFNTFLPPGYRIECSAADPSAGQGANLITVTTPTGTTTRTQIGGGPIFGETSGGSSPLEAGKKQEDAAIPPSGLMSYAQRPVLLPPLPQNQLTAGLHLNQLPMPGPMDAMGIMDPAIATPGAASVLGIHDPKRPPVEFNHAINYVNKIKNRFTGDPETYKTFLEILQTYQKEQRPIQDVYASVTILFKHAPDLLDEFKQFLPDTSQPGTTSSGLFGMLNAPGGMLNAPGMLDGPASDPYGNTGYGQGFGNSAYPGDTYNSASFSPSKRSSKNATGSASRSDPSRSKKRRHPAYDMDGMPVSHEPRSKSGKSRRPKQRLQSPRSTSPIQQQLDVDYAAQPFDPYGTYLQPVQPPPPPTIPPAPPLLFPNGFPGQALVSAEELSFFDKVKKFIDDRQTYHEFLKTLNLYSQEIVDEETLVSKVFEFIGRDEDLFDSFKELVGWDPVKSGYVNGEEWFIDNCAALERPKLDLQSLESFGPSYRKLPRDEIELACSGRDAHCWSVLNDHYVVFATWASEGTGGHKSNMYETALANSEQERHWYSVQIESLQRVIALLEPINDRITTMNADERSRLRLPPGLGSTGRSIVERIVKKIYGGDMPQTRNEHGTEVLRALSDNPAVAVPIVLARLKQKDEDWKKALREWNRVWREVDVKNHYRALDHQGVGFKTNDKRNINPKALITEIEVLRRDRQQKRVLIPAETSSLRPNHQFELGMSDRAVLFDVFKLAFSYLDRAQSGFSGPEKERVESTMRILMPMLFDIDDEEMTLNVAPAPATESRQEDDGDEDLDSDVGEGTNGSGAEEATRRALVTSRSKANVGLRRKLLEQHVAMERRAAGSRAVTPQPTESREGSPDDVDKRKAFYGASGDATWITASLAPVPLSPTAQGKRPAVSRDIVGEAKMDSALATQGADTGKRPLCCYGNSVFYCLLRLVNLLYFRLTSLKQTAAALADAPKHERLNPLAVDLGLATPVPQIDEGENPAVNFYGLLLECCERLFDGEIDQSTFEESLRYMWGIKAYLLFTVDKVVSGIIKQVHAINSEPKCQELVALMQRDRRATQTTRRQQIAYRMEAQSIIGTEEDVYKFEWISDPGVLTVQLLDPVETTVDSAASAEAQFEHYVDSFVLVNATEGVPRDVKLPFLKRNLSRSPLKEVKIKQSGGLEARVDPQSYALAFVSDTGDSIVRTSPTRYAQHDGSPAESKKAAFDSWLTERVQCDTCRRKAPVEPLPPTVASSSAQQRAKLIKMGKMIKSVLASIALASVAVAVSLPQQVNERDLFERAPADQDIPWELPAAPIIHRDANGMITGGVTTCFLNLTDPAITRDTGFVGGFKTMFNLIWDGSAFMGMFGIKPFAVAQIFPLGGDFDATWTDFMVTNSASGSHPQFPYLFNFIAASGKGPQAAMVTNYTVEMLTLGGTGYQTYQPSKDGKTALKNYYSLVCSGQPDPTQIPSFNRVYVSTEIAILLEPPPASQLRLLGMAGSEPHMDDAGEGASGLPTKLSGSHATAFAPVRDYEPMIRPQWKYHARLPIDTEADDDDWEWQTEEVSFVIMDNETAQGKDAVGRSEELQIYDFDRKEPLVVVGEDRYLAIHEELTGDEILLRELPVGPGRKPDQSEDDDHDLPKHLRRTAKRKTRLPTTSLPARPTHNEPMLIPAAVTLARFRLVPTEASARPIVKKVSTEAPQSTPAPARTKPGTKRNRRARDSSPGLD
ncbi:uncharacterized protein L969DRAFT_94848 [Mixia osmundae IAM 14324]|uniref:uncharacterized protein n=1 Tax=Mixia osmundae (strain CBS 9802 / IAM 14324 / JCM 22182 / KY 12970) TaxID=764103 RepID=UPI0004A54FCF|nr:uncharacterized protein L969DRAFT_94848 [Mixia osmundae IAM 14324]KEI38647.1 hypothetical protein L969DRAFT_94848 [Mixia osmundae IAM 14324]